MRKSNPVTKLISLLGLTLFIFTLSMSVIESNQKTVKTDKELLVEALNGALEIAESIKVRNNHKVILDHSSNELVVIKMNAKSKRNSKPALIAYL